MGFRTNIKLYTQGNTIRLQDTPTSRYNVSNKSSSQSSPFYGFPDYEESKLFYTTPKPNNLDSNNNLTGDSPFYGFKEEEVLNRTGLFFGIPLRNNTPQ